MKKEETMLRCVLAGMLLIAMMAGCGWGFMYQLAESLPAADLSTITHVAIIR